MLEGSLTMYSINWRKCIIMTVLVHLLTMVIHYVISVAFISRESEGRKGNIISIVLHMDDYSNVSRKEKMSENYHNSDSYVLAVPQPAITGPMKRYPINLRVHP